jgi:hypothetical protein
MTDGDGSKKGIVPDPTSNLRWAKKRPWPPWRNAPSEIRRISLGTGRAGMNLSRALPRHPRRKCRGVPAATFRNPTRIAIPSEHREPRGVAPTNSVGAAPACPEKPPVAGLPAVAGSKGAPCAKKFPRLSLPQVTGHGSRFTAFSNRHIPLLEFAVTYSKQRTGPTSNRHTFGGTLFPIAYPLSKAKGANLLTPGHPLLYICKVLEETGYPRAASNYRYCRGAGLVGAGIGNRFQDSFFTIVQKLFLRISAEVSRLGRFVLGTPSFCAARPPEGEEA